MRLFFARLDENHNLLESFEKIFQNFNRNIAKNAWFLHIFQKNLTNHALSFARLDEKRKLLENFWENFEKFWRKFYWKIEFLFYFYFLFYFSKICY